MDDKVYVIKESDILTDGYILFPISSLEEAEDIPEQRDGDEVSY